MNFALEFEEVDEELVTMADDMSTGLNVELENEEAMSEESWAGRDTFKLDLTESMDMADEIGGDISNNVIPDQQLSSDFAKDVAAELFGPENPAEVAEEIPKSLYEASVKIYGQNKSTPERDRSSRVGRKERLKVLQVEDGGKVHHVWDWYCNGAGLVSRETC